MDAELTLQNAVPDLRITPHVPDRRLRVLYESDHRGHFLHFVRHVLEELAEREERGLLVVTRDVASSDEFTAVLADAPSDFIVLAQPPRFSALRTLAMEVGASELVLTDARKYCFRPDFLLRAGRRLPVRMLVMANPEDEPRSLRRSVKRFALAWLERRESVTVKRLGPPSSATIDKGEVPDPVSIDGFEESDLVRDVRGWSAGKQLFLIPGMIAPWKNPLLVVEAFARAELPDACLLLCGPVLPEVRPELEAAVQRHSPHVRLVESLLTEAEFNTLVRLSHAVVQAYSTHAPNSTSAKAASLGTRVVAAGSDGFLKNLAGVGGQVHGARLEVSSLRTALQAAASSPPPAPVALPGVAEFVAAFLGDVR